MPQAQQYCSGNYFSWDPKLTTPPGLYTLSIILKSVLPISFWPGKEAPRDSRPFVEKEGADVLSKAAETIYDAGCHITELRSIGVLTLGLMFFVCWQIRRRVQPNTNSTSGDDGWWVLSEPAAVAANICMFPPLFFFSGLYYTDVLSTFIVMLAYWAHLWRVETGRLRKHNVLTGMIVYVIGVLALMMRQTNIFWVGLFIAGLEWASMSKGNGQLNVQDHWINRASSLHEQSSQGQLHNPPLSAATPPGKPHLSSFFTKLTESDPIIALLSLAISALTNPILLIARLWPYISLLITFTIFVVWNGGVVLGDKSNHVATVHAPQLLYLFAFTTFFSFPLFLPIVLKIFAGVKARKLPSTWTILTLAVSTMVATAIVHCNTIIHPFTLADNRHYMFYIFRYTILRHPLIKYTLCPIYVLAGWFIFQTLAGSPQPPPTRDTRSKSVANGNINAIKPRPSSGPSTIFTLIFALTTTLSLITAPLVEPRYFIIPWVMWRLHIASYPAAQERVMTWAERLWYIANNVATCWVFLNKPFQWASEPGAQRFMW